MQERQLDDDADHNPAVAPDRPVAARASAVVVPGGAVQPWPLRRQSVSSTASTTAASGGISIAAMSSSRISPSWSANQRAVAKNR